MKILLVEDEDDLRDALTRIINLRRQVSVEALSSGNAAIKAIKFGAKFDVIISDYNMPDGSGGDLLRFLAETKSTVPFILCSSLGAEEVPEAKLYPIFGSVLKPDVWKPLVALLERLRSSDDAMDIKSNSQFFKVSMDVITKINPICCPLYIQLSELKFIKAFNAGDVFSKEEEERYRVTKKLDSLYLRVDDCDIFVNALAKNSIQIENFIDKLNTPKAIQHLADLIDDPIMKEDLSDIAMMLRVSEITAPNNMISAASLVPVYQKAVAHVQELGFTPEVIALVTANVNLALSVLTTTESLKDTIHSLIHGKGGHGAHSINIAYLSCAIASIMPWKSDAARHKLALAAFLHDIELAGQELENGKSMQSLASKDKIRIREHPARVAERLKSQNCSFAYNIEQILLQHHERPDGTGYPRKLQGSVIDPLSSVFIVAHDLADYLNSETHEPTLPGFLRLKAKEYNVGHFHKIAIAMQAMI